MKTTCAGGRGGGRRAGAPLIPGAGPAQTHERWIAFIVIGSLMFVPGSYYSYLAYYAYRRAPGFTFDDIPEFD